MSTSQLYVDRIDENTVGAGVTISGARIEFTGGNPWFDATSSTYGAVGNNSTIAGPAIQAALNAAGATAIGNAKGANVWLPPGEYLTNTPLIIPNYVRLVGAGRSATIIKAGPSFPVSTPVVRLGSGVDNVIFGTRLENCAVYANNTAGSTCIYSTELNEQSGLRNVLAHGYMLYGVNIEDSGSNFSDNFLIEDIEIASGVGCTGGVGLRYSGLKQGGMVHRITVNRNDTTLQTAGVQVVGTGAAGCQLQVIGINVEGYADGVLFDTNAGGTVLGATLLTAGTNLVHIVGSQPVKLGALYRGVGTNTVKNDVVGQHVTTSRVMHYETAQSVEGYQVFTSAGTTSTFGNVLGTSGTTWTVKSSPTSGGASQSNVQLLDGNNNGWLLKNGANGTRVPFQLVPVTAGVAGSQVWNLDNTGILTLGNFVDHPKITAPGNCAANTGRFFVRDNGSGKMQFCAIFPSGAIQVIATEP